MWDCELTQASQSAPVTYQPVGEIRISINSVGGKAYAFSKRDDDIESYSEAAEVSRDNP